MDVVPNPSSPWLPPQPQAAPYGPAWGHPADAPTPVSDRPVSLRKTPPPGGGRARRGGRLAPVLAGLALLLGWGTKLKGLLLVLPKLKLFTTSASMLVSIGAYSLIWGWAFAAGVVALLFVHELGHYVQLRREGVTPSGMLFIPFLGAVIGARSLGGSALAEARVGLAGPILGSLAAAALVPVWLLTGNDFWAALAFTGFFLNLFNLLPVLPLDGGRAMAALSPWMWAVGFAGLFALLLVVPSPVLLLVALLGGFESYRRFKARRQGLDRNAAYYEVSGRHKALVGAVYLGLAIALGVGMDLTFVDRSSAI